MSKLVDSIDSIIKQLKSLGCEVSADSVKSYLDRKEISATDVDDDLLFEMADVLSGLYEQHKSLAVAGNTATQKSAARNSKKSAPQGLARVANAQVEAEIANVRSIVRPAAETIAELHAAVPYVIHGEAMALLEAQMPLIEQENEALMAEYAEAGRSAVAGSRAIANEFLTSYGLEGL